VARDTFGTHWPRSPGVIPQSAHSIRPPVGESVESLSVGSQSTVSFRYCQEGLSTGYLLALYALRLNCLSDRLTLGCALGPGKDCLKEGEVRP